VHRAVHRLRGLEELHRRHRGAHAQPAAHEQLDAELLLERTDLSAMIDNLESQLAARDAQLGVLETLIMQRELRRQIRPEGRPVTRGYLSSGFGTRQDPFTGHGAWHLGVDFAGKEGDPVLAVGAGIVTFAGERSGYGLVVEVNHGDGFVTRYAHNRRILVKVGDSVIRGHQLAAMGSTGRSTGPHVHFEVLRNGRQVNPLAYIGS
jgi:murein DD-endopeptidase MepM/ murein hydrolase activator NlpD